MDGSYLGIDAVGLGSFNQSESDCHGFASIFRSGEHLDFLHKVIGMTARSQVLLFKSRRAEQHSLLGLQMAILRHLALSHETPSVSWEWQHKVRCQSIYAS